MGSVGLWECSLAAGSTGISVFAGVKRWDLMQSLPLFLAVFIRQVLHSNSEITGDSISLISASRPLPFLSHSYHWSAVGGKTGGVYAEHLCGLLSCKEFGKQKSLTSFVFDVSLCI